MHTHTEPLLVLTNSQTKGCDIIKSFNRINAHYLCFFLLLHLLSVTFGCKTTQKHLLPPLYRRCNFAQNLHINCSACFNYNSLYINPIRDLYKYKNACTQFPQKVFLKL